MEQIADTILDIGLAVVIVATLAEPIVLSIIASFKPPKRQ